MVEVSTNLNPPSQPVCGIRWFSGAVLALATMTIFALAPATAQSLPAESPEASSTSDFEDLAKTFIQQKEKLLRLQTEIQFWEQELKRYEAISRFRTEKTVLDGFTNDPNNPLTPDSQRQLLTLLDQNYEAYWKGIATAAQGLQDEQTLAHRNWLSVRGRLYRGRNQVFEAKAQGDVASQVAQVFYVGNRWLWFSAMVAGACLVGVYWFHHRQYYRRLFWVRKTSLGRRALFLALLILIPAVPTTVTFVFGNQGFEFVLGVTGGQGAPPRQDMKAEIEELNSEIAKLDLEKQHEEMQARHDSARATCLQTVMTRLPKGSSTLPEQWIKSRDDIKASVVATKLLAEISKSLEQDLVQLQDVEKLVAENRAVINESAQKTRLAGGILGATLLAIYGCLAFLFVRGVGRAQRLMEKTCPRCLAVGKLEPLLNADGSTPRMGLVDLRCANVIRDDPFTECEFVFNAAYCDRTKLGFPSLGVSSSGKTHWMTMVYRELNRGRFPDNVHFEKVKGEAAREFDNFVDLIITSRIKMKATTRLPHPLIFNFRDNDLFGKSDVMLSLFDYAGQITIDEHHFHRRRALDANGYFFFLDPTKPDETQVQALLGFREDLRLMKNLKAGQQIHIPVALCITKLDLLVNQPYAQGSDLIQQFYQDLSQIDRSSEIMTMDIIQRRSDLVAQLTETIWPGWKIARQIRDLFGDRFMFFPLTPVGLGQPGVDDISQQTIEPYGIIEPLLWLLHMNGHPVLNRDKVKSKTV
ncbi:MAG: hypothetical protein ACKV2Q_25285 [Planctomycetaceae bacterium]